MTAPRHVGALVRGATPRGLLDEGHRVALLTEPRDSTRGVIRVGSEVTTPPEAPRTTGEIDRRLALQRSKGPLSRVRPPVGALAETSTRGGEAATPVLETDAESAPDIPALAATCHAEAGAEETASPPRRGGRQSRPP